MATRRKNDTIIDVPPETLPPTFPATVGYPADPPTEYDDVTALNNVLAELGAKDDDGFVVVHREMTANGKRDDEYLDRYPVGEFSLAGLKERWGAGKYKINVYHAGGGGLAARKVITIARDPTAAVVPAAQMSQASDLTPILQTMQQGFEKLAGVMMQMAQSQAQKPASRMEMLQEMQVMREIIGGGEKPASPAYDPVTLLKLGVEMANNGAGGDSNNSWVNKMLDTFGPALIPALSGAVQGAALPANTHVPHLASPIPARAPTPKPDTSIEEENSVNIIVVNYLNMLKQAAAKKAPVEEYADSILNALPVSMIPEIETMLRPDDWRDKLRAHTNAADSHPEWFTSLRDCLLSFIDEDKAIQNGKVSINLTPAIPGDSVLLHENADDKSTGDAGVPGSTA